MEGAVASRINVILLCIVISLQLYSLRQKIQVGHFQWLDSPGKQLGFDTATGKRCWVWTDVKPEPTDDIRPCAELAGK
jgi:hypothetical protein